MSRFHGIIVRMLYMDTSHHSAAHIHVVYNGFKASLDLNGNLLAGKLPPRQLSMVRKWIALHETELDIAWSQAVIGIEYGKIEPLD